MVCAPRRRDQNLASPCKACQELAILDDASDLDHLEAVHSKNLPIGLMEAQAD
jgi:hypothetical protein